MVTQFNLLIVEDEEAIREKLVMVLEQAGFNVLSAATAELAQVSLADKTRPDLIVLDWMLPGISGMELARRLKQDELYHDIPIILLTARGEEEDKIRGLETGADDYVTKPFSPRELVARIKAVLRRSGKDVEDGVVSAKDIKLDLGKHRFSIDNQPLLDQVWGRSTYIEERTVDVHIRRLRKILKDYGKEDVIQTVRGFGYRFSVID